MLALATTACSPHTTAKQSQITLNQEPPYTKTDNVQKPVVDEQKEEEKDPFEVKYGPAVMMFMVAAAVLLGSL